MCSARSFSSASSSLASASSSSRVRPRGRVPAVGQRERRELVRLAEAPDHLVQPRLRRVVQAQPLRRSRARRHLDVRHDDRPPEQVVQDDERVGDHHDGVRHVERVGGGARQTLDGAHQVVAQVAHRPAREARQARRRRRGRGSGRGGRSPEAKRGTRGMAGGRGPATPRNCGRMRVAVAALALGALVPAPAAAQAWNSGPALELARRAVLRRGGAVADSSLHDYKAQAHGFLFFLGAFGQGLADPPRLVKADQLELEVYWKAPASSKQRVIGWRDQAQLPTDINYHRDHLGIIQNNFGVAMRLGEGDEVRDVPHPLSPAGPDIYDFALDDTTTIMLPEREVRVVTLRVRPKDFTLPRIVRTLYLDVETADLVRVRCEVEEIAGRRALTGLTARRLGVRGVSDIVHSNRVEGLALGAGIGLRSGGERRELRARATYGFADDRAKGALSAVDRR